MNTYEVRDPDNFGPDEWVTIEAYTAKEAAVVFLSAEGYDPNDYGPGAFSILVRRDGMEDTIRLRAVPARFEVA